MQVTYDIGKDPAATAVCSLRALDVHKTAVGIAEVTIGPTDAARHPAHRHRPDVGPGRDRHGA